MDAQQFAPVTMTLGKVTLAAGTTTTLSNTGTTVYAIRGKAYSKGAMTNAATPTADWVTGVAFIPVLVNQGCVYMVGFDSGQNLRAIQGTIAALDGIAGSGKFITAPQFGGTAPAGSGSTNFDFCPIGYLIIQCGTTFVLAGGWIFGSSNMSAVTGVTYTFMDVIGWPDRPQVS